MTFKTLSGLYRGVVKILGSSSYESDDSYSTCSSISSIALPDLLTCQESNLQNGTILNHISVPIIDFKKFYPIQEESLSGSIHQDEVNVTELLDIYLNLLKDSCFNFDQLPEIHIERPECFDVTNPLRITKPNKTASLQISDKFGNDKHTIIQSTTTTHSYPSKTTSPSYLLNYDTANLSQKRFKKVSKRKSKKFIFVERSSNTIQD